jgi:CheY-like chemotaxis protein
VVSLFGWLLSLSLLFIAWRRGAIERVSAFGIDVRLQREAVIAVSRAAEVRLSDQTQVRRDIASVRSIVTTAFRPEVAQQIVGKRVLWVDDRPDSVRNEVQAFEAIGLFVDVRTTTDAALEALECTPVDLIISDMARHESRRAGYEFLEKVRATGSGIPFLIYSSSDHIDHKRQALQRDAQGSTNDPRVLLELAINNLTRDRPSLSS